MAVKPLEFFGYYYFRMCTCGITRPLVWQVHVHHINNVVVFGRVNGEGGIYIMSSFSVESMVRGYIYNVVVFLSSQW